MSSHYKGGNFLSLYAKMSAPQYILNPLLRASRQTPYLMLLPYPHPTKGDALRNRVLGLFVVQGPCRREVTSTRTFKPNMGWGCSSVVHTCLPHQRPHHKVNQTNKPGNSSTCPLQCKISDLQVPNPNKRKDKVAFFGCNSKNNTLNKKS